jgi:hypothetical protein
VSREAWNLLTHAGYGWTRQVDANFRHGWNYVSSYRSPRLQRYGHDDWEDVTVAAGTTSTAVTGLTNGQPYSFEVPAVFGTVESPPSVRSSVVHPSAPAIRS